MSDTKIAIIRKSTDENVIIDEGLFRIIEDLGCTYKVEEFDRSEFVNILEWAVAGSVALFIAKPYFEAMMQKLGEASGEAIVAAIKGQFKKSKYANERLISKKELEKIIDIRNKDGEAEAKRKYEASGKKIAPFEIDVYYDSYEENSFTARFIFPANLDDADLDNSLTQLRKSYHDLIKKIFDERIKEMPILYVDNLGKIECIYSKEIRTWLSRKEVIMRARDGLPL